MFILGFLNACSSGSGNNHQKKLAELDKVYGACNNPHRQYTVTQKKVCEDAERAAGPDGEIGEPMSFDGILNKISGRSGTIVASSDTNNFLWDSSLSVLNNYSLKITNYDGGYIETNWIKDIESPDQRCLIKSHITSKELVSNGVKIKIICENLIDGNWYLSKSNFINEEKQLTLKILKEASILSNRSENS